MTPNLWFKSIFTILLGVIFFGFQISSFKSDICPCEAFPKTDTSYCYSSDSICGFVFNGQEELKHEFEWRDLNLDLSRSWFPNKKDIEKFELELKSTWDELKETHLNGISINPNRYLRQYVRLYTKEGEKIIYISLNYIYDSNYLDQVVGYSKRFVKFDDGWWHHIYIQFDVKEGRIMEFKVNGRA